MTKDEFLTLKEGDKIYKIDSLDGPQEKFVTTEPGHNGQVLDSLVSLDWLQLPHNLPWDKGWHPYRAYELTYDAANRRRMIPE